MGVNKTGRNLVRDLVSGASSSNATNAAVGTGTTAFADADTALEEETLRKAFETFTSSDNQTIYEMWIASTEANGDSLTEIGILNAAEIQLQDCDSTSGFTAVGNASNITLDNTTFKEGTGAINFDMDGGGATGSVYDTISSTDISSGDYLYVWANCPDTTNNFTKFSVRLDSVAGVDYYEWDFLAASLVNGWNLLKCDLSSADTTAGTFDNTSVIRVTLLVVQSIATAETDFIMDDFRVTQGSMLCRDIITAISKDNTKEVLIEVKILYSDES